MNGSLNKRMSQLEAQDNIEASPVALQCFDADVGLSNASHQHGMVKTSQGV